MKEYQYGWENVKIGSHKWWLTEINKIKHLKQLNVVYDLTDLAVFDTVNDPENLNYGWNIN